MICFSKTCNLDSATCGGLLLDHHSPSGLPVYRSCDGKLVSDYLTQVRFLLKHSRIKLSPATINQLFRLTFEAIDHFPIPLDARARTRSKDSVLQVQKQREVLKAVKQLQVLEVLLSVVQLQTKGFTKESYEVTFRSNTPCIRETPEHLFGVVLENQRTPLMAHKAIAILTMFGVECLTYDLQELQELSWWKGTPSNAVPESTDVLVLTGWDAVGALPEFVETALASLTTSWLYSAKPLILSLYGTWEDYVPRTDLEAACFEELEEESNTVKVPEWASQALRVIGEHKEEVYGLLD